MHLLIYVNANVNVNSLVDMSDI